jgi:hypothetical protein
MDSSGLARQGNGTGNGGISIRAPLAEDAELIQPRFGGFAVRRSTFGSL